MIHPIQPISMRSLVEAPAQAESQPTPRLEELPVASERARMDAPEAGFAGPEMMVLWQNYRLK